MRYQKNYGKLSANSPTMIRKQQIRISDQKKIRIKSDAKKMKYCQFSKKKLSAFHQFYGHDHKTTN